MALSSPYTVNARTGFGLAEFALENGVDLALLAQAVGLDPADFQKQEIRISLEVYVRFLDMLATAAGDDCFGLRFGERFVLGRAGALSLLIAHAPTLGRAIEAYNRFQSLTVDSAFFFTERTDGETSLNWRYWPLLQKTKHFVDFQAAVTCRLIRRFLGENWYPTRVELVRAPPVSLGLHRKLLCPNIKFNARMNCIVFPSSLLATSNPQSDERVFPLAFEACERELDELQGQRDLRKQIKAKILSALPNRHASLTQVASDLAIGERSLQRRLAELGTSFDALLEETRRELSDRLLATSDLPLSEIGYLCGYANAASYSRAATVWYGVPPSNYREQLVAKSA